MKNIIFIHGMFLNGKMWDRWVSFFKCRGYCCNAPSWPLHEGEPADLRANIPAGTGKLSLDEVVTDYAVLARAVSAVDKPIIIGHSLGGLIAQKLVAYDLASAAVCISAVAPNAMLSFDWGFFKNCAKIADQLRSNTAFEMTTKGFHENFCNRMTEQESATAYNDYAVHASRTVLHDAMDKSGHIDLNQPHAPLLFIAGEHDRIIPDKLNYENAEAYTDRKSISDFKKFSGRGHFICGEPGWQDIAAYTAAWLVDANIRVEMNRGILAGRY